MFRKLCIFSKPIVRFCCILLILAVAALTDSRAPLQSYAQDLQLKVVYRENFDNPRAQGWNLQHGWYVRASSLHGSGHRWARYNEGKWGDAQISMKLAVRGRGLHVNVRNSHVGRYAIGINTDGEFQLHFYLFKQIWPDKFFNNLADAKIILNPSEEHEITIITRKGNIQVYVGGRPVLNYTDPNPLPPGTIAFETLDDGSARIDDIVVKARVPVESVIPIPPRVKVPNLAGYPVEDAQQVLAKIQLGIGRLNEIVSDRPPRTVLRQRPNAGTMVAVGSAVDLWLAAEDRTNVPNLIGRRIEEAHGILGSKRLQIGMVKRQFSSRPKQAIIGQIPQPGARVQPGTFVNLTVSRGKETAIIPILGAILSVGALIIVVTIAHKIFTRKPERPVETSEGDLDVTVNIHIKPITDPGRQVIEIEGSSIFEEGENHE